MAEGYGKYIGSIYFLFDVEGEPQIKTYDNEFKGVHTSEVKSAISTIISKHFNKLPVELRKHIRALHEYKHAAFSCFKTIEENPDRFDTSVYVFGIYTRSVAAVGLVNDENGKVKEAEEAKDNAVKEILEYLENKYGGNYK